jgi:uncharacterized short protein YbdD (DUF466 family)
MTRLAAAAAALRRVLHQVIGAPDYERYVAHVRECHPDRAPMTREEFARERLEARYSRPGSRCC